MKDLAQVKIDQWDNDYHISVPNYNNEIEAIDNTIAILNARKEYLELDQIFKSLYHLAGDGFIYQGEMVYTTYYTFIAMRYNHRQIIKKSDLDKEINEAFLDMQKDGVTPIFTKKEIRKMCRQMQHNIFYQQDIKR